MPSAFGAALAVIAASALPATRAEASHCRAGLFYRPSLHICVGRSAFLSAAFHHFSSAATQPTRPPPGVVARKPDPPAPQAQKTDGAVPDKTPVLARVVQSLNPFGGLTADLPVPGQKSPFGSITGTASK